MAVTARSISQSGALGSEREDPGEHLMLDPRPRGEMNAMVMELMQVTSWRFWAVTAFLVLVVAVCLVAAWSYLIANGLGVSGANRPSYWEMFLVNTVFWIGIAHAGTFVSALLRVLKVEFRRPFTRVAELMTAFALINVGLSVFMHLGQRLAGLLVDPLPQRARPVAELSFPADVGLPGNQHLPGCQYDVPDPAAHPGPGHGSRPLYWLAQAALPGALRRLPRH